jgi:uncharacterized protein YndB with AHSA1/START domain
MTKTRHPLLIERQLAHPPEAVWAALTDPDQLDAWLATTRIDLATGGRIELRWHDTTTGPTTTTGIVTHLEEPTLLECRTNTGTTLRWELAPDETGGCLLRFTNNPSGQTALATTG